MSKYLKSIALVVVLVLAGGGLWWWWQQQAAYPSTDDAYVHSNILGVAPEIGGKVIAVDAVENTRVSAGDVLFRLDTAALQAQVDAAQANLDMATQNAGASGTRLDAAEAQVTAAEAALKNAGDAFARISKLAANGDAAKAAREQARTALDQARAQKSAADATLAAARQELGQTGSDNAGVRAALANLDRAKLDLAHATVRAPVSGWIANITLRPGQVVAAGQPLFSLVEDGTWWVDANFKETDLERIRPGQSATVAIDMYPGTSLKGRVESIGAGSGAVFSLLPAENATGNWVKVTRRFPVRVALAGPPKDKARQLRVGASATVTIDTVEQAAQ